MQQKPIMPPDKGINRYLPSFLIDDRAWSDGYNVRFGVGFVEKAKGYRRYLRFPDAWTATTAYSLGAYVRPTVANNHVYKCTTAGTSGGSQPTWPTTAGGTVTDGTAVWTEVGYNKLAGVLMALDNYYQYDGDAWLMAITTTRAYRYDDENNTFVDITGATALTGTTEHPVVTENAQNYFVFTNGIDPVKYWTGTGNIADLPGLTDCEGGVTSVRAKTLLYFQNFLLLGNTTEDGNPRPQRIRWSCLGDITAWKNVAGDITKQEAGYGDLTDDVSFVQALRPLGNYVVAYKERAIQMLNYAGGTTIWNKWPAIIGTGMLAAKAIVDLGEEHIFVGNDNVYSFNGRDPAIAGDDMAKEFFRLLDPDKYELITGFFIEEAPELWFAFVSVNSANGYPDKAITYNTDTKAWAIRDMPMTVFGYYNLVAEGTWDTDEETWDSDESVWDDSTNLANAPINLCGDANGNIYSLQGNSLDGAAINGWMRTKLFDFEDAAHVKRALRIQFMVSREGAYNLNVKVYTAGNVDEPLTLAVSTTMSLDVTSPPWVDFDVTARYMMFEFGTAGTDEPFRLTGYMVYYDTRGEV